MAGNITATGGNANTKVAFTNGAPFIRCVTRINDEHIETAGNLDINMPMYNSLEYSILEYLIIMQILLEVYISLKEMNKI